MAQPLPQAAALPVFLVLKTKQRAMRESIPDDVNLRLHRAISWLGRAEAEREDIDVQFILLWVGFNAAYARNLGKPTGTERDAFNRYFQALVKHDPTQRIYNAVWDRFPHEIRVLLDNKYVFAPFWNHHNGEEGYEDWEKWLTSAKRSIAGAMKQQDTSRILSLLFDRLYVLRNQLVHGGATWKSKVNRNQVRDGAALIGWLLPIFIDIMLENPHHDWGRPHYPVVE